MSNNHYTVWYYLMLGIAPNRHSKTPAQDQVQ